MTILKPFALVVCLAAPAASFAQATTSTTTAVPADAMGTWNASFNTQNGVIPATLKLEKSGDKITGTIGGPDGTTPVEAEVKGKTLTVWFNYAGSGGGTPVPIEMVGSIDGDSAKGTMTAAGSPAGDWTATRDKKDTKDTAKDTKEPAKDTKEPVKDAKEPAKPAPAGKLDLSGAWNVSLQLDTITATPSLTLKQDGSKLTGEYVSQQYGKFPLTGEVTGTAVTFSVSMNIEGNAINAVYTGVVQADGSLKGTVDLGGAMSGTFSATRKK